MMKHKRKTPLAWKNLTHDWRRLGTALAGIGFAVLLMFMQVGFQNALFDSQVKIIDDLQGDIFLTSKAKYTLAAEKRFPLARIHQARACPGVSGVYPVYTELTTSVLKKIDNTWRNKDYPLRTIGFFVDDPIFGYDEIQQKLNRLRGPATALIDRRSKTKRFKFTMDNDAELALESAELAGKKITLVGTFDMGTDFAHEGNLIMSAENFAKYFPHHNRFADPLAVVDVGVIHLHQGTDVSTAVRWLKDHLDDDVGVFARSQFREAEVTFWNRSTPIGIIFMAGKMIGFVVGMVICYQVIFSDIADHMPEFATLKAMGYPSRYFVWLMVVEAMLLSVIGFIPGMAISKVLYEVLAGQTGLLMRMNFGCIALVFSLTVAMCVLSGLIAVRKLLSADPASLF